MRTLSVALLALAACRSGLEAQNAALRAEIEELRGANAALRQKVEDAEREKAELAARARGPKGRVLSVRSGQFGTLVSVSIGSADGLRVGDTMLIRSSGRILRMTIDRVESHQSVGYCDEWKFGPPRSGDTVQLQVP